MAVCDKNNLAIHSNTLSVAPVEEFTAEEIKEIRKFSGMTQALFAQYLGVSVKAVEAWEGGRNKPNGTVCRMLSITRQDPLFPMHAGIVTVKNGTRETNALLETLYLQSVPGMREKIDEGINTPANECLSADEVDW